MTTRLPFCLFGHQAIKHSRNHLYLRDRVAEAVSVGNMIRLKKKAEEKKENEAAVVGDAVAVENSSNGASSASAAASSGTVDGAPFKLLGIDGRTARTGEIKSTGKKKTPGEIRIQKGSHLFLIFIPF